MIIEAGQVAVVTGAAQGLGRALAAGLIDRGVSVVLADTATEPVFAGLFAYLLKGERLSATGWLGAGLIMAAIVSVLLTDLSSARLVQSVVAPLTARGRRAASPQPATPDAGST